MSDVLTFQEECRIEDTLIVEGFMRSIEVGTRNEIPVDIINLCFKYYHIGKGFDSNNLGSQHILNGNIIAPTGKNKCWSTVLLKNTVSDGKHKWKFKICQEASLTLIGICDATVPYQSQRDKCIYHYGYGYQVRCGWIYGGIRESAAYGISCNLDDTVTLHLDMDKCTVGFSINEKHQGIAFENVNLAKCKAAV